jgi:hypothetical protein
MYVGPRQIFLMPLRRLASPGCVLCPSLLILSATSFSLERARGCVKRRVECCVCRERRAYATIVRRNSLDSQSVRKFSRSHPGRIGSIAPSRATRAERFWRFPRTKTSTGVSSVPFSIFNKCNCSSMENGGRVENQGKRSHCLTCH